MSWESDERDRAIKQIEELVRERNRLLRERSNLRAALRALINFAERLGGKVGPHLKLMSKARRR